ncbi:PGPGW domain-containing protein [Sanguibacter sp. 25GB23B1]|uniref:PGPGW domain-containing protein n=1 Tax=unclassified Sanguibacter TaxID=2645534 RepID=UPI0032AFA7AB
MTAPPLAPAVTLVPAPSAAHEQDPPETHPAARLLERVHERLSRLPHPVRVATITVVGAVLILAGLAMLVLPGPGLVTMFAGVAVLSTEFPWASRLLHRVKVLATRAWEAFKATRAGQKVLVRVDDLRRRLSFRRRGRTG